jgi:hypothetical protein
MRHVDVAEELDKSTQVMRQLWLLVVTAITSQRRAITSQRRAISLTLGWKF